MSKKIAVIVRDRQAEALRMAIGLTLMDDTIDIFLLNRPLEYSPQTELSIETIREMEMNLYSNIQQSDDLQYLSGPEFANNLLDYDHILPY